MAAGSIFSGLVKGLGSSLGAGYERKRAQDMQKQQYMLQLLSSSLMNDDTLPGGARREGLRQIGQQYGVKIPDELLDQIVPDLQVETDKPQVPPMPQSPISQSSVQAPAIPQPQQQAAAQRGPSQGMGMHGELGGESGMQPMPRNPLMDPPQVVPGNDSRSAPVVKQYTQGPGSTTDNVELQSVIQKLESQLANPPTREWQRDSSRKYSRLEIQQMRQHRLQMEEAQRDLALGQLQDAYKIRNKRNEQSYDLAQMPSQMHAQISAMEGELGRPLTVAEKQKFFNIGLTGEDQERANEEQDYRIANDPAIPETAPSKLAAVTRVKQKELANLHALASSQNLLSEIRSRAQRDSDPMNRPGYVAKAKAQSAAIASSLFSVSDKSAYMERRKQYWMEALQGGGAGFQSTGDPERDAQLQIITQIAQSVKGNPTLVAQRAIEFARKDAQDYQAKLADAVFNYGFTGTDAQVVNHMFLRRLAQQAQNQGGDPNKIWGYYKSKAKEGKVIILDDDMNPWQEE